MILMLHIAVALTSILYTAYVFYAPSAAKLVLSYALAGATLTTGTYLVVSLGAHLVEACSMGLVYIAAVGYGIVTAHTKLAAEKSRK